MPRCTNRLCPHCELAPVFKKLLELNPAKRIYTAGEIDGIAMSLNLEGGIPKRKDSDEDDFRARDHSELEYGSPEDRKAVWCMFPKTVENSCWTKGFPIFTREGRNNYRVNERQCYCDGTDC